MQRYIIISDKIQILYEPIGKLPSFFKSEIHAIERCVKINAETRTSVAEHGAILSDSQAK